MQYLAILFVVAVAGLVGYLFMTGHVKLTERSPANCPPVETPTPSSAYPKELSISLHDGKFQPNRLEMSGPVIKIRITSFASHKHNVILAEVKNCQERELRREHGIVGFETRQILISLPPGEYVLYCDIRQGQSSHREAGEVAKLIVH
jgi:hypothetical protein